MKSLCYVEYKIISDEEVTIFTPTKVKVMKKVKKDKNGYYVRGGYWYPAYKLYLKDYEKNKGIEQK